MGSQGLAGVGDVSQVLVVVLALFASATLPALAYASPPDPSWIEGIYDDADSDDVVVLVTSGTGNVGLVVLADLRPTPALVGPLTQSTERATPAFSASAVHLRAPPVS